MPTPAPPPAVFDRALLAARLERACRAAPANVGADFLLRRAAEELADRLSLVRREFAFAADVGAPAPHAASALAARSGGAVTLRLAPSPLAVGRGGYLSVVGDLERLPLAAESFDLIVSLMALHHVNDLPGALIQMRRALRPDGLFLAALAGGETLSELRQSLTMAESEILGGAAPRVAPFADVRALGGSDATRRLRAAGRRCRFRRRALRRSLRADARPAALSAATNALDPAQPQAAAPRRVHGAPPRSTPRASPTPMGACARRSTRSG